MTAKTSAMHVYVLFLVSCVVLVAASQRQRVQQGSGIPLGRLRRFFQGLRWVGRSRRIAPQQCVHFFESHPPIGPESPIVVVHYSSIPFNSACWRRLGDVYRRRVQSLSSDSNVIITLKIEPPVIGTIPDNLCSQFRLLGTLKLHYSAPIVPYNAITDQCTHLRNIVFHQHNTATQIATDAIHHASLVQQVYVSSPLLTP